jgi:hypothetical protein
MKTLGQNAARLPAAVALSFAALVSACSGTDQDFDVEPDAVEMEEHAIYAEAPEDANTLDLESVEPGQELGDKAGRSIVQFCDVPNSNDGTRCLQQGCSGLACIFDEPASFAECRSEVATVCGSPTPVFVWVSSLDGHRHLL